MTARSTSKTALFAPQRLTRGDPGPAELRERLFPSAAALPESVEVAVRDILDAVRREGDAAVAALTAKFDRVEVAAGDFSLSIERIRNTAAGAEPELRAALDGMIANVRRFHEQQRREGYRLQPNEGVELSWRLRPVRSAAVYVPGGLAAYPTSVVMNVVPAQIAGVPRIVVVTPPGSVESNPAIAYALQALGVAEVLGIGGAQAVAAVAYGTESIEPVDVIVGPGNAYVAAAKRQLYGLVGLDGVAGPSEVVILADDTARPDWIVQDLLAQAEHDELARCMLVTPSADLAAAVAARMPAAVVATPRSAIVRAALEARGANVVVDDLSQAVALVNRIAAEHLQVMLDESSGLAPEDLIAGAIFWGPHTPTAVGDYWAGPNHVLPTGGTARFRGPLGVDDFLVPSSVVRYSPAAARRLQDAERLARAEGLWAHAGSLASRRDDD